jgi:hypothetical protein
MLHRKKGMASAQCRNGCCQLEPNIARSYLIVTRLKDNGVQIRPKTYLHLISLWRSLRDTISPHHDGAPAKTSPFLIYTALVLAMFVAILEVDAHRVELESLGLLGSDYPIEAAFLNP